MGVETFILAGLAGAGGISQVKQANKQAKSIIAEGNIVAQNKSDEVLRKADRATMSFLNSGFGMRGTPESAVKSIFDIGLADVNAIKRNYDRTAKQTVFDARSKALNSMLKLGVGAIGGGSDVSSMVGNASGFQYGLGGSGGIPTGGFANATGVPFGG